MTSKNDARDILSLGSNSSSNPISKSSKSSKKTAKPSSTTRATELGISRELYALLGDNAPSLSLNPNNLSNPLLPKGKSFKPKFKRKPTKAKKWKQVGFKNPARNDGLVLRHWNVAKLPSANEENSKKKNQEVGEAEAGPSGETQKDKEVQENGEGEEEIEQEYRFAQFNTTSGIYSYSNDEYNAHLRDDDWTQAETDYLMDLCTSYDLRFVVIHDRYDWPGGKPRSIEDLKSRYYAICRRLIRSRISAEDLESRQALVNTYLFDPKREIERKKGVARLFEKTPQQLAEEEALYVEAKRMEQNEARFSSERESLLRLLGGWESLPNAMMDGVARAGSGLNIGLGVGGSGSGGVGEEEGRPRRKRHTEESTSGLTSATSAQVLTTKQKNELKQASFDLEHCIQRFDPTLTIPSKPLYPHLIGIPSSYPPTLSSSMDGPTPNTNVNLNSNASHGAYFRSTRILTTRPHLLIRTNQTLSELIPPVGPKLVFPTARNIEKWEGLLGAVTSGLEMKKALDRVESELRVAQGRYDSLLEQQKEKEKNKEEGQNGDGNEGEGSGLDKGKQREKTQEELRIEKSMEMMIQARDKDLDRDRIDREVEKSLEQSLDKEKEDETNANSNKRPRSESLVDGEGEGEEAKRARREE